MPGTYYDTTVEDYLNWPKANYIDPIDRTWLPPYAIFLQIVATIGVFGRLYVRTRKYSVPSGWDDYLIFFAWIFSVAFTVSACIAVWDLQVGRHVWDMELSNWVPALRNGWLAQVFFTNSACATKLSILGFYLRLFSGDKHTNTAWLWSVWTLIFLTSGTWIAVFSTYCAMCRPLSDYWNWPYLQLSGTTEFHCVDGPAVIITVGVLTIASDFWCAALPCLYFQYHDLGITKRQRMAMNIIFCTGFSVSAVGAVRTYYLWLMAHNGDTSWVGYNLYAVCVAECQLGIICCCAPFLRVFFRKFFPNGSNYLSSRRSHYRESRTTNDERDICHETEVPMKTR